MSFIYQVEIDGNWFSIVDLGHPDGVLVPFDVDVNNPAFLSNLHIAQQLYPFCSAVYAIDCNMIDQINQSCVTDALNCYENLKSHEHIFQQICQNQLENYLNILRSIYYQQFVPQRVNKRKVASKKEFSGFVYLIQSPTKAYKIGRTSDPQNRMKTFGIQLPFEVEYICIIETPDMIDLETKLHTRFSTKRINGEWFDLSPEDVEYIKGLANE
jgi:hypothetical protein